MNDIKLPDYLNKNNFDLVLKRYKKDDINYKLMRVCKNCKYSYGFHSGLRNCPDEDNPWPFKKTKFEEDKEASAALVTMIRMLR